uniref:Uncharacterized protein n=1 Tax=Anguilla anguilla TaxID=7936 RepID=A0A0E9PFP7_ANGAN
MLTSQPTETLPSAGQFKEVCPLSDPQRKTDCLLR